MCVVQDVCVYDCDRCVCVCVCERLRPVSRAVLDGIIVQSVVERLCVAQFVCVCVCTEYGRCL